MSFREMTGCSVPFYICKFCCCVCARAGKIWEMSHCTPNFLLLKAYARWPTWISLLHLGLSYVYYSTRATSFVPHLLNFAHFNSYCLRAYHVQDKMPGTEHEKGINPWLLFLRFCITVWIHTYVHKYFLCKNMSGKVVACIKCCGNVNNVEL